MARLLSVFIALSAISAAALSRPAAPSVQFQDVTRQSGVAFQHNSGAFGKKYLPETLGPGVAFIDYDNDGWQDLFFTNGKSWPGQRQVQSTLALYRNNHDGTFRDVTRTAGLAISVYGMGAAAGDFDNDGDDDLFVTTLGQDLLLRNDNGVFTDVAKQAGLSGENDFGASAAWLDYDRDGRLDLVVANYVRWTPESDLFCTLDGAGKSYCTPESYKGASPRLWRNKGDGTFEDATRKAGLFDDSSKGLGVVVFDANGDGWPDMLIANDTQPNRLYVNNAKGGFREAGVLSGVAFSESGVARAGMGVDAADYDRSGAFSVMLTNFSNEMLALYHNEGNGLFVDEAPRSELGRKSLLTLGFGCFFFDYDLDGWLDVFVANGHIEKGIERIQTRIKYAQPTHLFQNVGKGRFQEVTEAAGAALAQPRVARGAAYGDLDNDGDLDIVMTTNGGPAVILRNDGTTNKSLRLRLTGIRSNRDGFGALVRVTAGGETQTQMLHSGSSYLSQSERILTFGLGTRTQADAVEVRWPSGQVDRLTNVGAGRTVEVREGSR